MKKLFCAVFLLLSLFPVSVCAVSVMQPLPSFDLFSSYSVDELLRSLDFILGELEDRGYSEVTLTAGKYTVGNEILPGKYILRLNPEQSGYGASLIIDDENGERVNLVFVDYNPYSHVTYTTKGGWKLATVELSEGQFLTLVSHPITFYTYDGI